MINENIRHRRFLDLEALHLCGSYGRVEAGTSDSICSTLDDEDTGGEERVDEKNVHTHVYHSIIQSKTYQQPLHVNVISSVKHENLLIGITSTNSTLQKMVITHLSK